MPNPWDVGSALLLQHLGFASLATTSSGLAASMGRLDGAVSLAELGVRRVSTGGSLAWAAYGAMVTAAIELRDQGTNTFLNAALPAKARAAAFFSR